jgi:hypothetical protein
MVNAQRFPFIEGRDTFGDIDAVPQLPLTLALLLGRMNFFVEFDVCFYRSQMAFELRSKS